MKPLLTKIIMFFPLDAMLQDIYFKYIEQKSKMKY